MCSNIKKWVHWQNPPNCDNSDSFCYKLEFFFCLFDHDFWFFVHHHCRQCFHCLQANTGTLLEHILPQLNIPVMNLSTPAWAWVKKSHKPDHDVSSFAAIQQVNKFIQIQHILIGLYCSACIGSWNGFFSCPSPCQHLWNCDHHDS